MVLQGAIANPYTIFKCLLIIFYSTVSAQIYSVKTYGLEDGLSQSQVTCLKEDENGFLWLGTNGGGVCRFDGTEFLVFSDKKKYESNAITTLEVDQKGDVWFGSIVGGLNKLSDGIITNYDETDNQIPLNVLRINNFNNILYISTNSGIITFTNGKFESVPVDGEDYFQPINGAYQRNDGTIIFLANGSIILQSKIGLKKYTLPPEYSSTTINTCIEINNNEFFLGTLQQGLLRINLKDNGIIVKDQVFPSAKIFSSFKDRSGNIWIATYGQGVYLYQNGRFIHLATENGFGSNVFYDIYEIKEGGIWFGGDGGLSTIINDSVLHFLPFEKYGHTFAITERNDKIIVATTVMGIVEVDKNNFKVKILNWPYSNKYTRSLFVTNSKDLWAGGLGVIAKADPVGNKNILSNLNSLARIDDILVDKNNNLWAAVYGMGILKYSGAKTTFYNSNRGLLDDNVRCLAEDSYGNIWCGTNSGVSRIRTGLIQNITTETGLPNSLVLSIKRDSNNNMWFGTYGGGIVLYKIISADSGYIADTISTSKGLPNSYVLSLFTDHANGLWVGTNSGAYRLDLTKYYTESFIEFKPLTYSEGFTGIECNHNSSFEDSEGNMWFGTAKYLTRYSPKLDVQNKIEPKVFIKNVSLFHNSVSLDSSANIIERNPKGISLIELDYNFNHLTFEYSGINLKSPLKTLYKYRLMGAENNWSSATKTTTAIYPNISPGKYDFEVIASVNGVDWNNIPCKISIVINPPWWRTWWFYISAAIIFLIVLLSIYYARVGLLKKQKRELEQAVNDRTVELKKANEELQLINASKDKFFSIVAHDLKNSFNSLMAFSGYIKKYASELTLEEIQDYSSSMYQSVNNVFELLENLLHWSRHQTGRLKYEPIKFDLVELVKESVDLYRYSASEKQIELRNSVENSIEVYADRDMIFTILRNFISNAVKFTNTKGHIQISANVVDGYCEICISDDGMGIEEDDLRKLFRVDIKFSKLGTGNEKGTGLGLLLCKEFIEMNKGSMAVESVKGKGSRFCFTLPVCQEMKKINTIENVSEANHKL